MDYEGGTNSLSTATQHWEKQWKKPEARADWSVPEEEVRDLAPFLMQHDVSTVLDLGCGIGRHALYLADLGFSVAASDASPVGLAFARAAARRKELQIDFRQAEMNDLPFADGSMNYVLAWNVIYHGDLKLLESTAAEVERLLSPGGYFHGTALSKRNVNFGRGERVATDTWINYESEEKRHPHCYCSGHQLSSMLERRGFDTIRLVDTLHDSPGSWHWHFLAEKAW
jgi:SAM-dependent methyltransferase